MHYFAAQRDPAQRTTLSLRASQYQRSKKRKRDKDVEGSSASPSEDPPGPLANTPTQSQASFASQEEDQLRVAGLLPGDAFEPHSRAFPHAPARTSRDGNFNYGKLQKELADLQPPLYAVNSTSKSNPITGKSERPALRETHLGVLTTILHHCLLEGEYQRAGRAWGMILRSQIAGRHVDVRNHGRWGIGAEILLHRNASNEFPQSQINQEGARIDGNEPPTYEHVYTEAGFELAKEYYRRLIVQYPNRKLHPNRVDEVTFYPAMFSLWIYEVYQKSKSMRQRLEEEIQHSPNRSISLDEDTTMDDARAREAAIREDELEQARKIKETLDGKVTSPPFDKRGELLELRGMVGLWIGDLVLGGTDEEGDWPSTSNLFNVHSQSTTEGITRRINARKEFEQALEFLHRAQGSGRRVELTIRGAERKMQAIDTVE